MQRLPTDREILRCIYKMYEAEYPGGASGSSRSENDPYISIDVRAIASRLKCKPELLFGRLYYYLDHKHRYRRDDGSLTVLFDIKVGEKRHAVHFPFLVGILASHEEEHRRQRWSLRISITALLVSLISLAGNLLKH